MFQKLASFVLALALISLANIADAQDRPIRVADLPREFQGQYQWGDGSMPFTLILKFEKIEEKQGTIHFSGSHFYMPGDWKAKIDGTIDAKSGRITIWESEASRPGLVTDGSFVGAVSSDLQSIEALWTTNSTGNTGWLKVKAKKR